MGYRIPRKVEDDRGVTHTVTHARRHALWPMPWHDTFHRTPLLWRIALVSWFIMILFMMSTTLFHSSATSWIRMAMGCLVIPLAAVAFLGALEKSMKPWSKAQQLDPTRCRACDYNLESLTPDPDGCTTCPECGAVWRQPPILPDA